MSSWVAPSVAAEIWGVSVDQIMAGIANGSIPSYVDGQFLFVDIQGKGITPSSSRSAAIENVVTEEEYKALTYEPRQPDPEISSSDEPPIDEEDEMGRDVGAWRTAREQSARTRRPPNSEAA